MSNFGDEITINEDMLRKMGYDEDVIKGVKILAKSPEEKVAEKKDQKNYIKYLDRVKEQAKEAGEEVELAVLLTKRADHIDNVSHHRRYGLEIKGPEYAMNKRDLYKASIDELKHDIEKIAAKLSGIDDKDVRRLIFHKSKYAQGIYRSYRDEMDKCNLR